MRKLMWFAIGFAISCGIGVFIYPDNFMLYGICALILGVVFAISSHWVRVLRITAVVLIAFAIGTGWFSIYNSNILSAARALDSEISEVELTVTDYSVAKDSGCKVSAAVTVDGKQYAVIVYLNKTVVCKPGDTLRGQFAFRFTAEGGLKDPTYHRSEGVFLLAYPYGEIEHQKADAVPQRRFPAKLRMQIIQKIEALFPKDAAAFAKALLLGDRTGIDYETNTAFKVSGISHIVAVSGLHVSILFAIAALFSGRNRFLLFVIGMPTLLLFAAVTGFTPSVTRACIMQAIMLTALLINKEYDPPTALSAAALIMLIVNPMVILSISFQLSFGCMIGIFLFSGRIFDWILDENHFGSAKGKGILSRLKQWFARSVSVSLSAAVITTPLVAVYFGAVSLIGILTNLVVVWLVSYIFYGVMLACGISLLSVFAGRVFAWITVIPIRFVLGTSKLLAQIPFAAVYTESVYIVIWFVFLYVMLAVFLCLKKKPVGIYICTSAICLCAAMGASWAEPLLDGCRVTMLDVGQGQCILLQSEGKTFMVDCGGSRDWEAADKAAETLLSQGVYRLDGIILTHYDEDHAAGIPYLLSRIDADAVYLPDIVDDEGFAVQIMYQTDGRIITVSDDLSFSFGDTQITIYGPETYNLGNESSLCVLFQRENCDILITGDRGELGELLLMNRTDLPQLDVLVAGHHGSANSTGEDLLGKTTPEYIMISAGAGNRYGHPAASLLERLLQYGCVVLRTDLNGTIIYRG